MQATRIPRQPQDSTEWYYLFSRGNTLQSFLEPSRRYTSLFIFLPIVDPKQLFRTTDNIPRRLWLFLFFWFHFVLVGANHILSRPLWQNPRILSPLRYAVELESPQLVELLCQAGAVKFQAARFHFCQTFWKSLRIIVLFLFFLEGSTGIGGIYIGIFVLEPRTAMGRRLCLLRVRAGGSLRSNCCWNTELKWTCRSKTMQLRCLPHARMATKK